MTIKRTEHWATREYHQFLMARAKAPFAWGGNDCALFAADGVQAFTGVDIATDFRGKYHDEASAFALIKSVTGGATVADAAAWCARKHGLAELPKPLFAQRGDLVVFASPTGSLVAGLVALTGAHLVSVGESGLFRFSISKILKAWRV